MEVKVVPDEAIKLAKQAKQQATRKPTGAGAMIAASMQKDEIKIPKWQLQRMQLQEAVRAGREVSEAIKTGAPLPPPPAPVAAMDDRVPCPYWCAVLLFCFLFSGRKFNVDVADRHIPKCESMKHNKPKK